MYGMAFDQHWREIRERYAAAIRARHPGLEQVWPILSGHNVTIGFLQGWKVLVFQSTNDPSGTHFDECGEFPRALLQGGTVVGIGPASLRKRIEKFYRLIDRDAVFLVDPSGQLLPSEIDDALRRHEFTMGLIPTRIFLSHKSNDKTLVRDFASTLRALGFDPWLDEDAMDAGAELERALLKGFEDSCAAVFFITKNYVDDGYLASEVNYAIAQKRTKAERFSIVTITFDGVGQERVPGLLRQYVWKSPKSELEALREILRALPVQVGDTCWKA